MDELKTDNSKEEKPNTSIFEKREDDEWES